MTGCHPGTREPWIYTALTVASLVLLRVTIYLLRDLLLMLMVALFLSFAMEPAVNWLADRGWRRGAATGLVFCGGAVGRRATDLRDG
ncbi:MAG: AI-2E family transporter [Candidatus Microthrix sp.]|nr:hypothetical protein [Candidatus Microthrix sp.]MBK6504077.1 AI-2E family transporter [Candidatus Microthrix sp.]